MKVEENNAIGSRDELGKHIHTTLTWSLLDFGDVTYIH